MALLDLIYSELHGTKDDDNNNNNNTNNNNNNNKFIPPPPPLPPQTFTLTVVTFDHHTREGQSEDDARHVENYVKENCLGSNQGNVTFRKFEWEDAGKFSQVRLFFTSSGVFFCAD